MGRHLKLVSSFILAVFLFGQATKVEKDAEVTVKLRKIFGSLTSDEDIKKNTQQNLQSMFNLAEGKLRTYRQLDEFLNSIGDDVLKELYQENTESQAQIPSAEDIRKNIENRMRKMMDMTDDKLMAVLHGISEDDLRKSYQEYKADMLLNSKADKGRRIDVIGIFATVAVSVALLGF